jgi:hypothetical protein
VASRRWNSLPQTTYRRRALHPAPRGALTAPSPRSVTTPETLPKTPAPAVNQMHRAVSDTNSTRSLQNFDSSAPWSDGPEVALNCSFPYPTLPRRRFLKRELVSMGDVPAPAEAQQQQQQQQQEQQQQQAQEQAQGDATHRVVFSRVVTRAAATLGAPIVGVAHAGETLRALGERVRPCAPNPPHTFHRDLHLSHEQPARNSGARESTARSLQRCKSCESCNVRVWDGATENGTLNEGQIPNFRGVRVPVSTGNTHIEREFGGRRETAA